MGPDRKNPYRLDDLLLRTDGLLLLAAVAVVACAIAVGLAEAVPGDPGFAHLQRHAFAIAVALASPIGLLWAGLSLRSREKKIAAI